MFSLGIFQSEFLRGRGVGLSTMNTEVAGYNPGVQFRVKTLFEMAFTVFGDQN